MGIDTDDTTGVYGNHQCVHKTENFVNCSQAAIHFDIKVPEEVGALRVLQPPPSPTPSALAALSLPLHDATGCGFALCDAEWHSSPGWERGYCTSVPALREERCLGSRACPHAQWGATSCRGQLT